MEFKLQTLLDAADISLANAVEMHLQSKFPVASFMSLVVDKFGRGAVREALKSILPESDRTVTSFDKTFDALDDYTKAFCATTQRMVGNFEKSEKLEKSIKTLANISETDLVLLCSNSRSKFAYIREIARRISESPTLIDEIFKQREEIGDISLDAWLFAKGDDETYRASCAIMKAIIPKLNESTGAKGIINPLKDFVALLKPEDRADLLSLLCKTDSLENIISGSGALTVLANSLKSFSFIDSREHLDDLLASVIELYDKQIASVRGGVPFQQVNELIIDALVKSNSMGLDVGNSLALSSLSPCVKVADGNFDNKCLVRPDLGKTHYLDVVYGSTDHNSKAHSDLASRAAKVYGITSEEVIEHADKHWKLEMVESLIDKRKVLEKSSLRQRAEYFAGDLGL